MPRIAPLPQVEWDDEVLSLLLLASPGGDRSRSSFYTTMARHPVLMRSWVRFGGTLLHRGRLPTRDRELAILRTAWSCKADFEWEQHVEIAHANGVTADVIERITRGAKDPGWTVHEAAIIASVDELRRYGRIQDATWTELARTYDDKQLIELPILVGHYHTVAWLQNTLRISLEIGPGRASR